MKLQTTLGHMANITNTINASLVNDFYRLRQINTSENYQNQNLKQIIGYAKLLEPKKTFLRYKEER